MKPITPQATRIGWIGTGVMGRSMCGHLLTRGTAPRLYTRTRAKAQALLDRGAAWADSPRAVAESSDVLFTIVGFPRDVRDVYFSPEGMLAGTGQGALLVDMTTTEPTLAREIHQAARAKQAQSVDAPVSGGDVGARKRALSIMVGGDEEAVASVMPLLSRSWARTSSIRVVRAPGSTPRCATRS